MYLFEPVQSFVFVPQASIDKAVPRSLGSLSLSTRRKRVPPANSDASKPPQPILFSSNALWF
jgi:hypothetical protein